MNFWQIFFRVLPWRPGAALTGLWWQVFGRRVRARNCVRVAGANLPFAYKLWMRNVERQDELEKAAATTVRAWVHTPSFVVIIDARQSSTDALLRSIRSVQAQSYAQSQVLVLGRKLHDVAADVEVCDTWNAALQRSDADFVVPVTGGDQLSKLALFHLAKALQGESNALILYGDEDRIDPAGRRCQPWFKPKWNEELFLARDYVSRACAIDIHAAREACANLESDDIDAYRLILRALKPGSGRVIHVPSIVTHLAKHDQAASQSSRVEAVRDFVSAAGAQAEPGPFGSVKVSWPLPANLPLVTIIVPTRDKLELLRPCVESILAKTTYQPFEILIVDNESSEPATLDYLDELKHHGSIRILRYRWPYNYSAINNFAARQASGS